MRKTGCLYVSISLSPGTHVVGSWVIDSISLYRDPRTGTPYIPYIGNWASGVYMYIYTYAGSI